MVEIFVTVVKFLSLATLTAMLAVPFLFMISVCLDLVGVEIW